MNNAQRAILETARTEARNTLIATMATSAGPPPTLVQPSPDSVFATSSLAEQFREMQQLRNIEMEARRQRRQQAAAQPPPEPEQARETAPPADDPPLTPYDGDEFDCSICADPIQEGQRVVRLQCRHVFHGECYEQGIRSGAMESCPNCRGSSRIVGIWNFIGPRPDPTQGQPNLLFADAGTTVTEIRTPRSIMTDHEWQTPGSVRGAETTFPAIGATGNDVENWTSGLNTGSQSEAEQPRSRPASSMSYAAETEMADGRQALLIDPGSWGNLAGENWVKRAAQLALRSGKKPVQEKRPSALTVKGVGNGTQSCSHNVTLPVALERSDGKCSSGTFTTPTINGSNLPALLGLKTLIDKRAVLDLPNMQLHFLGPGDITLNLPPGSESYPIHHAPSGHLMLPCCEFQAARRRPAGDEEDLSLVTRGRADETATASSRVRTNEAARSSGQ